MTKGEPPALGPRLHGLRKRRGMTLDQLAAASGVSRSMLSQIERGEANPTFATLWNLVSALGVEFAELTEGQSSSAEAAIEVVRPTFTPEIKTEDGKCVLRILSPPSSAGAFEWYVLTLEPGGRLTSEPHAAGSMEHLTVLDGNVTVTAGAEVVSLSTGATARYRADKAHEIRNDGKSRAQSLLVIRTE